MPSEQYNDKWDILSYIYFTVILGFAANKILDSLLDRQPFFEGRIFNHKISSLVKWLKL